MMSRFNRVLFTAVTVIGIGVTLFILGSAFDADGNRIVPVREDALKEQQALASAERAVIGTPIVEEVSVSAAGAYTLDGGELYTFRAEKRWPIASITKLMTSLVAYEFFELDDVVTITDEMIETEGTSGGFSAGERITIGDLIEAALLVSSNDAARALAISYGEDAFVARMNNLTGEIGMSETTFVDPTGLSVQNFSTVEDLRKLALYIWENEPHIFEITQRETGSILDIKSGNRRKLNNINIFAGRDDFLGGKTGQIPEAEGNLLSIFEVTGRSSQVLIIVLGADDRFFETENILKEL